VKELLSRHGMAGSSIILAALNWSTLSDGSSVQMKPFIGGKLWAPSFLQVQNTSVDDQKKDNESFDETLKRNYIQSLEYFVLNAASQGRLEMYLDRNLKLAQWVENPKLVPRDGWRYATLHSRTSSSSTGLKSKAKA